MVKKMVERVSTGIQGLDELMQGGFLKGSINIVSGPTGSGKTTAAMQFIYEGAKNGENVLYVTLEENRENLEFLISNLKMDMTMLDKNFFIVDGGRIRSKVTGTEEQTVGGILDFNALRKIIETFHTAYKIDRLVIDCLTAIGFRYANSQTFRADLFNFSEFLRKINVTAVLLTEVEEGSHKISRFDVEEFIADGVIKVGFDVLHNLFQRFLLIRKMRFTNHSVRKYAINLTEDGIIVEGELMG